MPLNLTDFRSYCLTGKYLNNYFTNEVLCTRFTKQLNIPIQLNTTCSISLKFHYVSKMATCINQALNTNHGTSSYRELMHVMGSKIDLLSTKLYLFAEAGLKASVRALMVRPAVTTTMCGKAVVAASAKGHISIVRDLLEYGPIPQEHRAKTLIKAVSRDDVELFRFILNHNVEVTESLLHEGLMEAAKNNSAKTAALLFELGPIESKDVGKALVEAASSGADTMVGLLLQKDVSEKNRSLAVYAAAKNGFLDCIKLLIPSSDIKISAHRLRAALDVARNNNEEDMLNYLNNYASNQ